MVRSSASGAAIHASHAALTEIERLKARIAELEEENASLRERLGEGATAADGR